MNRAGFHFLHAQRRGLLHALMIHAGEFQHMVEFLCDAEGQRDALRRSEVAEQRAITGLMISDIVEDQRRRIGRMLAVEHIDDGAHL